jgi:hypothetical protein|tara:strand:+ start:1154 stop:1489 length:336 start_codon:yes stop_codon:yes gene_type:complete
MYTLSRFEDKETTVQFYKRALRGTGVEEKRGLMVHFVPQFHKIVKFEKLASKLTRETWKALQNSSGPIEMIDGSQMSLDSLKLEEEDVNDMLRSHRNKEKGPWFIRFLRAK